MINRTKTIVDGKVITYFDSDSSALLRPVIIFVHDNSQSLDTFHYQLTDSSLSTKYRLIALDLPGHGESDQLPSYSLREMSSFFEQFIQGLNLDQYALMGHGLGMKIILASLKHLTPLGLISWGFAPQTFEVNTSSSININNPIMKYYSKGKLSPFELLNFYNSTHFIQNKETSSLFMRALHQVDKNFRPSFHQSLENQDWEDEVEILKVFEGIKLHIYSKNDFLINFQYLVELDKGIFSKMIEFHHSGHFSHTENYKLMNRKIESHLSTWDWKGKATNQNISNISNVLSTQI